MNDSHTEQHQCPYLLNLVVHDISNEAAHHQTVKHGGGITSPVIGHMTKTSDTNIQCKPRLRQRQRFGK